MKDFSINSLEEFLGDLSNIHLDTATHGDVQTPFQTKPCDFLRFAEYDLNGTYEHHLINALSNVKRAIDCQLDSLLFAFGLYENAKNTKMGFPKKVLLLNSLGIISPRILRRINQQRNLLEHEYVSPRKTNVEDALDVANLFIAYTNKFLQNAILRASPYNEKLEEFFNIGIDYEQKYIELGCFRPREDGSLIEEKRIIKVADPQYQENLRLFLSLYSSR